MIPSGADGLAFCPVCDFCTGSQNIKSSGFAVMVNVAARGFEEAESVPWLEALTVTGAQPLCVTLTEQGDGDTR